MTATEPGTSTGWSGAWVRDRLGVDVRTTSSPVGLDLHDLVGLAVRRNPRRAHLLVSRVLGKHVPTDPRVVHGAGLLLGLLVRDALAGTASDERPGSLHGHGDRLRAALADHAAAAAFRDAVVAELGTDAPDGPAPVVLGYAETAVALGFSVAAALAGLDCLHSTRRAGASAYAGGRRVRGGALARHQPPAAARRPGPAHRRPVASAGAGRRRAQHRHDGGQHDRRAAPRSARATGTWWPPWSTCAAPTTRRGCGPRWRGSAPGSTSSPWPAARWSLPADVLERGAALVEEVGGAAPAAADATSWTTAPREVAVTWPHDQPEGARHGLAWEQVTGLEQAAEALARRIAVRGGEVHVLGTEELMAAPLLLGCALADAHPDVASGTRPPPGPRPWPSTTPATRCAPP